MKIELVDFIEAYDKAFEKLLDKKQVGGAWFDTEQEAEKWAGDVAFDMAYNLVEALGFEIFDPDEERS